MIKTIIIALCLVSIAFAANECTGNHYYDTATKLCVEGTLANCVKVGDTNTECTDGFCALGYGFNGDDNSCVECSQANCIDCDGTAPATCTECDSGYGIADDGSCVQCTVASGCEDCDGDSPDVCTECPTGDYLAADDTCGTCAEAIANCDTCDVDTGVTICIACATSKYLKADMSTCEDTEDANGACTFGRGSVGGSCTACTGGDNPAGCLTCDTTASDCDGGCLPGYSSDGQGGPCSENADDPNCPTFVDGACAAGTCNAGYYLNAGVCSACIEGCTDCQTNTPVAATACETGYCDVGYFEDNDVVCHQCGVGCNTCTSDTECSDCIDNYRANAATSSTGCWQCPPGCIACSEAGDTSSDPKECISCLSPCATCTDYDACETCATGFVARTDTSNPVICDGEALNVAGSSVATKGDDVEDDNGKYTTYTVAGTGVQILICSTAECEAYIGRGECIGQVGSTALTAADLLECGDYFVDVANDEVLIRADYSPDCIIDIKLVEVIQVKFTVNFDSSLVLADVADDIIAAFHAELTDVTVPIENLVLLQIAVKSRRRMLAAQDYEAYIKVEPCTTGADASTCSATFADLTTSVKAVDPANLSVTGVTIGADAIAVTEVAQATDASAPVVTPSTGTPAGPSNEQDADDDEDGEDEDDSANINKFFGIVAIALMIVANYI